MAATIQLDLIEDASPSKAYLTAAAGESVTGTPDAAGYTVTLDSAQAWRYTLATSGLVGIFRIVVHDGDAATIATGFVWIQADAGGTYIAGPDFPTLKLWQAAQPITEDWTDGGRLDLLLDSAITKINTVDTVVDAILVDTGTTLPATLATIDGIVDAILVDTDSTIPGLLTIIDTNVDAILIDTDSTLPSLLYKTNSLATSSSVESIYARVDEAKQVSVTCSKAVDGLTLEVVVETTDKTDVATIANGSITKSGTTATFSLTTAITASERTLRYTVKNTADDETLASGKLFVTYDAQGD